MPSLLKRATSSRLSTPLHSWPAGFPGGSEVKVSASNAGDPGSIPGSGRSPGEGNGNPLQHSWLENPMDGGPGGLQSMGSQRARHDWVTSLSLANPPLSTVSQNVLQSSRKRYTCCSFIIAKLQIRTSHRKQCIRDKSQKVPNRKLPSSMGMRQPPGTLICDKRQNHADQGDPPELYWDFITLLWLPECLVMESNSTFSHLLVPYSHHKASRSNDLIMWSIFLPWPALIQSYLISINSPPCITHTLVTWEISKV